MKIMNDHDSKRMSSEGEESVMADHNRKSKTRVNAIYTKVSGIWRRKRFRKKLFVGAALAIAIAVISLLLINFQKYTKTKVLATYEVADAGSSQYQEFAGGIVKYNCNGISFLTQKGKEKWNRPVQFQTPIYASCEDVAVIANQDGNKMLIFKKDGVKSEIKTSLPIQKAVISKNGIVGALLKHETVSKIVCYDTNGKILVEHKASPDQTGYPMDLAISPDAHLLMVSYLSLNGSEAVGKIVYYSFEKGSEDSTDHQAMKEEAKGEIIGKIAFLNEQTSVAVGENKIRIYQGVKVPSLKAEVKAAGEIQTVFYDDEYVGVITKKEGAVKSKLSVYNAAGKEKLSKELTGEYGDVLLSQGKVIMRKGNKCSIYTMLGIHKFEGALDDGTVALFPVPGINKYLEIGSSGFQVISFTK